LYSLDNIIEEDMIYLLVLSIVVCVTYPRNIFSLGVQTEHSFGFFGRS